MKFILLTHERETLKDTNTGRLVKQVLAEDAEVIIWKRREPNSFLINLLETKQAALVFPSDHKTENEEYTISKVYDYLIILDATWQEARKMFNRSTYLKQAERVALKISKPSEYKLRRNQKEGGLSTVECVIELLKKNDNFIMAEILNDAFVTFNQK